MAITRIKNNQITDSTIVASAKCQDNSVTAAKLENNMTYPSNMTITGDLTVNGTTTTINTTNTTVEDPILVLGSQQTGTAALDFGFIGERGTDQNVAFVWDEATDEWVAGYTNASESSTTITVTAYADMHVNDITAEGTLSAGSVSFSDLTVTGTTDLQGDTTATNIDAATLDTTGNSTIGGTLGVTGDSTFSTLSSSGLASLDSISTTDGITVGTTLAVTGTSTFTGDMTAGNIDSTTLDTTGAATVGGTLGVTGALTTNDDVTFVGGVGDVFTITDGAATTFSVDTATGNTDVQGTLGVTGASTFIGDMTAGNIDATTLDTTGAATVGGTLGVTGATTMAAVDVNGGLTANSAIIEDLTNDRVVIVGTGGELEDDSNFTFNGTTLDVGVGNFVVTVASGNTAISGTLDVDGQATLASVNVEDLTDNQVLIAGTSGEIEGDANLTFDGTTLANGVNLTVAGTSTFDDDITLTGGAGKDFIINDGTTTTFSVESSTGNTVVAGTGTLTVAGGDTSLGGALTVTGATDLNGATTMGALTVDAASTLDFGANKLTNLADGTNAQDAVTLSQLNATIAGGWDISDGTTTQTIALGETLNIEGTTNEVEVAVVATDIMRIGLPDNVTLTGNLTAVNGSFSGTMGVTGATTLSTVSTSGLATLDSASVTNNASVGGTLTATGAAALNGGTSTTTLSTSGLATLDSASITNNATVGGDIDVTGDVGGATATITGNTTVGGTLGVTGATTLSSTLNAGASTLASATITSNATVGGTLGVTGATTVTSITASGAADFNGATTLANTTWDALATIDAGANKITNVADPTVNQDAATKAYVDAQVAAGGSVLTVDADTGTPDGVTIGTDTLLFAGTANEVETAVTDNTITIGLPSDVTIGNDLTVTGNTSTATLAVSGLADLNGTLDVLGTSNFTGAMTTTNITSTGTVDITGQLNIDDLTINGTDISATAGTQITIDPFPAGGDAGGDVIIYGNLQVTGTQTTVNSTVVQIDDPMMALGTDTHTNTALDSGLKMQYSDGADKDAFAGYDISAGEFIFVEDATDTAGVISGALGSAAFGSMRVTDLTTDRIVIVGASGELEDDANFTFDGTTLTVPNVTMSGDISAANITATGNLDVDGTTELDGLNVDGASTFDAITSDGTATLNGATTINNTLGVTGTSTLAAVSATTLSTSGLATLNSASVTNNATVGGTFGVTGTSSFTGDMTAGNIDSSTLDTTGNVTVGGTLDVTGASTFENSITINGGTGEIFKVTDGAATPTDLFVIDNNTGAVTASGTFTANSTSDFNGAVTMGDLTFDAASTIDGGANAITNIADPSAAQDAATKAYVDSVAAGGWTVSDGSNTSVISGGDTFTMNGTASEVEVAVSQDGDAVTIGLPDNVAVTGTLSSGGAATLNSLSVTNNATVTGTLDVDGTTELDGLNVDGATTMDALTADGAVSMTSTLGVTGVTTLTGQLNANGGINADGGAFTVADTTGNVATTGSMTIGTTLDVTGVTTATDIDASTLDLTGAATVGSTLDVTGAATFSTDVVISGGVGDTFTITDGAATPTTLFEVNADTGQVDATAINVSGNFDVNGDTTVDNFTIGGSSTVSMGGNVVNNVGTPVAGTDAVNLDYITTNVVNTGWTLSDGSTSETVQIGDTVTLQGTANEVDVAVSAVDTMTIGLPSDVDITATLDVGTNATVGGTLGVTGATTTAGITNTGNIGTGTLSTTGAATLDSAAVSTTLTVTGVSTFNDAVDANGGVTANTMAVEDLTSGRVVLAGTGGELEDSANLTFNGSTLTVTGDVSASGDVAGATATISGNATVGGTLGVTGATTLSSTLDVNGTADLVTTNVVGVLTVTGSAAIDNVTIDGNDISPTAGTELTINDAGGDFDFRVEGNTDANLLFVDAGTDSVNIGTATAVTDVQLQVAGTDSTILSKGTTAERPATGVAGMLRYNTTTDEYEFFDGGTSQWSGFGTEFTVIASETFSGDDSTVAFTLSSSQTTASCIVSINGVVQLPTTAYGVSGTTLTFTEAPATGDTIEVRELTTTTSISAVSDGTYTIETGASGFDVTGDLIPAADATYDLGSASNQWAELHLSGTTMYLGGLQIKNNAGTFTVYESDGVTLADISGANNLALTDFSGGTGVNYNNTTGEIAIGQAVETTSNVQFNNVTVDGTLNSDDITAATMTASGNVVVQGNLTVNGTTTTVNSTTLDVTDLNITVADGSANDAAANGAGITFGSHAGAGTFNYASATDRLVAGNVAGVEASVFYGESTSAQYADLAEMYLADGDIEPGTVVSFGGEAEVTTSAEDGDRRIAGVVSTDPAYLMNSTVAGVPVALQGRVPCKVTGTIKRGDMLVSAGNGAARAEDDPKLGSVIGKALEDSEGDNVIEVVVGRL